MTVTFTTANVVSRALGAARFKRSVTETTRVRGYHRTSSGFKAVGTENGDVAVTWHTGLNVHTPEHKSETTSKIIAMAGTLTDAGFVLSTDKAKTMILVTGKVAR